MPTAAIKRGHRGSHVQQIQQRLNRDPNIIGFIHTMRQDPLAEDGVFGLLTHERVVLWQSLHGRLKADGIVGPKTWEAMFHSPIPASPSPQTPSKPAPAGRPAKSTVMVGPFYLIASDTPGKHDIMSKHRNMPITFHEMTIENLAETVKLTTEIVAAKNLLVSDLVINTHGSGPGTLSVSGQSFDIGKQLRFFEAFRGKLARGARIYIYSCGFALRDNPRRDREVFVVNFRNLGRGKGTEAMRAIARHMNAEVWASPNMQWGTLDSFKGGYVICAPNGELTFYWADHRLSMGDFLDVAFYSMFNAPFAAASEGERMADKLLDKVPMTKAWIFAMVSFLGL